MRKKRYLLLQPRQSVQHIVTTELYKKLLSIQFKQREDWDKVHEQHEPNVVALRYFGTTLIKNEEGWKDSYWQLSKSLTSKLENFEEKLQQYFLQKTTGWKLTYHLLGAFFNSGQTSGQSNAKVLRYKSTKKTKTKRSRIRSGERIIRIFQRVTEALSYVTNGSC